MSQRNKFGMLLLILLVIAAVYYFLSTPRGSDMVLIGTVDANQVIVNSKIPGRVMKLTVDEGSVVKAGDLIAELDDAELKAQEQAADYTLASLKSKVGESAAMEESTKGQTSSDVLTAQANVQSTRAQLAEAQANLTQAQIDQKRIVTLADQGVASQAEKDKANSTLNAAQARVQALSDQVRAAEATLKATVARTHQAHAAASTTASSREQMQAALAQKLEAEARLAYTKIYAPVNGTVSVRAAREGEVVNPGEPIVTIVDLDDTWVRAAIPETEAGNIGIGDTLRVRVPGGQVISGKVIYKAPDADFATQRDVSRTKRDIKSIGLKLKIDNSRRVFVPGMTAEVLVSPGQQRAPAKTSTAEAQ